MITLETIFSTAPADCEEIRISCRVYYKTPVMYILTGWLHVGQTWQRIEAQADQPEITQGQLDRALLDTGWNMDDRPTRRSTTEFVYAFKRATGKFGFSLHSKNVDYVDRRVEQLNFQRYQEAGI